jgi:hypothetical protein
VFLALADEQERESDESDSGEPEQEGASDGCREAGHSCNERDAGEQADNSGRERQTVGTSQWRSAAGASLVLPACRPSVDSIGCHIIGLPDGASAPNHTCAGMPFTWHNDGMARIRVSTTVDGELLADAREALSELSDAALLDEALAALLRRHRAAEIDAAYAAYETTPPEKPDAWGDLASFREAAAAS